MILIFFKAARIEGLALFVTATASAFLGAFLGSRFMTKVTMRTIRIRVSIMLLGIALGLGSGLI